MPRIGCSITKSIAFRNSTQEFSNVYFYELDQTLPSQAEAVQIIDSIAAREKLVHSSVVSFNRGRLWSQTATPGTSEMIDQHALSGTGARAFISSMDRERAILFRIRAGVDSRGNPVYLRKWFHSCGEFASGTTFTAAHLEQSAGFSQAVRDALTAALGPIQSLAAGGKTGSLVSKTGRAITPGSVWSAHQFLEHHQLGDQWRSQ